jgi:hypothetical protein
VSTKRVATARKSVRSLRGQRPRLWARAALLILENGVWRYDPHVPPLEVLRLTHSRYAAGYELCRDGGFTPLASAAPAAHDGDVIELRACAPR